MSSTYTTNNGIEKIGTGEQSGTWGTTTNKNFDLIDESLDGQVRVTLTALGSAGTPNDISISDGATSDGRKRWVEIYSATDLGGTAYVRLVPNDAKKITIVRNSLAGSRSVVVFQGTYNASNAITLASGEDTIIGFDGGGAGAVVKKLLSGMISRVVQMLDDAKAYFGTDNDAQIYHSGGNFFIQNATGTTKIIDNASGIELDAAVVSMKNAAATETMATFTANGAASLYYDNSAKLATTSTGISVTGTITPTGNIVLNDNVSVSLGTGSDATLSHNGSNTVFQNITGDLRLYSSTGSVVLGHSGAGSTFLTANATSVVVRAVDVPRLTVGATGISVTGDVVASGNLTASAINGSSLSVSGDVTGASASGAWIATVAEAQAGTDNTQIMTPLRTAQYVTNLLATQKYVSPEQTITSGGLLTLAHGLGAVPSALQFRLVCKTAEHGYAVGAVIATELAQTGGGTIINTASMSAANVNIRFSSAANCFTAANFSTGAPVTLTNANWRLVVLAWL